MAYAIYVTATGAISKVGSSTGVMNAAAQVGAGEGYVMAAIDQGPIHDGSHYVVDGVITTRPEAGISLDKTAIDADGVDEATVSGIPAGSLVEVDGEVVEVTDGTLELSSDANTVFFISIEPPFPFISWSATVTAS